MSSFERMCFRTLITRFLLFATTRSLETPIAHLTGAVYLFTDLARFTVVTVILMTQTAFILTDST